MYILYIYIHTYTYKCIHAEVTGHYRKYIFSKKDWYKLV